MIDKIKSGQYNNKLTYKFPIEPKVLWKAAYHLTQEDIESLPIIKEKYNREYQLAKEAASAYEAESARLLMVFKQDCEDETGLSTHPKKDRLFELAYDMGRSAGLPSIWDYYLKFYELLK